MSITREFIRDAAERAISTFAQAFAAVIVAEQTLNVDALKIACVAGVLSVAKAIAATRTGDPESAGLFR